MSIASISALMDIANDRVNPIVIKELRQAVKSRMVIVILMVFLSVNLLILGYRVLTQQVGLGMDGIDWYAGNRTFMVQQVILLWTLAILVPAYAAIRLGAERADQNVDLLFISTLKPGSIIWGKFIAALVLSMLIFGVCAPFMTFTFLMRGIDMPTILAALTLDVFAMLLGTMLALLMGSLPGTRPVKFGSAFFGFIIMAYGTGLLTILSLGLVEVGAEAIGLFRYWWGYLTIALAVLGFIALLYLYAVALISPPSSDRLFAVRLFLFCYWAVLLTLVSLIAHFYRADFGLLPFVLWTAIMPYLIGLQFMISTCERETWGHRIRRSIPRFGLFRTPAFLFYSGSAGGITLTVLMMAVTFFVPAWFALDSAGGLMSDGLWVALRMNLVFWAQLMCYGLTGVLLRSYFLGSVIRPGFTWVVTFTLIGVGSSVPSIFAYIFFSEQMRMGGVVEWWYISFPLAIFWEAGRHGNMEFEYAAYGFVGGWSAILLVASIPWYMRQLHKFRPWERPPNWGPLTTLELAPEPPSLPAATAAEPPPLPAPGLAEHLRGEAPLPVPGLAEHVRGDAPLPGAG